MCVVLNQQIHIERNEVTIFESCSLNKRIAVCLIFRVLWTTGDYDKYKCVISLKFHHHFIVLEHSRMFFVCGAIKGKLRDLSATKSRRFFLHSHPTTWQLILLQFFNCPVFANNSDIICFWNAVVVYYCAIRTFSVNILHQNNFNRLNRLIDSFSFHQMWVNLVKILWLREIFCF